MGFAWVLVDNGCVMSAKWEGKLDKHQQFTYLDTSCNSRDFKMIKTYFYLFQDGE